MKLFIKTLILFFLFVTGMTAVYAEEKSMDFVLNVMPYFEIETITSPVLVANITDRSGNLFTPLFCKFKITSNSRDTKTLYLKANTITEGGNEEAMFEMNGRVYIAFANLEKTPKSQSLANCKLGTHPEQSPGIVAYPVTSIYGTESKYLHGRGRYEVYAPNGTTYVTVNVGSHVLRNSFASNDPKGFYQATLSLTESDI